MTGFDGLTQNMWRRFGDKARFWIAEACSRSYYKETAADTIMTLYGFEIN